MRLIDADSLMDRLKDYLLSTIPSPFDDIVKREEDFGICCAVQDCIDIVQDMPEVEAVETAEVITILRSLLEEYKQKAEEEKGLN